MILIEWVSDPELNEADEKGLESFILVSVFILYFLLNDPE